MQADTVAFDRDVATFAPRFRLGPECDQRVVADLRTDHAGETGAVWIYKGVLRISRDPGLRTFAGKHLETERRHLDWISTVLPGERRSKLTPLWRLAGWLIGALPSFFGPRAVYLTIEAVETFVDQHYQEQIDYLRETDGNADLIDLLKTCQADEVSHRDEASGLADARPGPLARAWMGIVGAGSRAAVVAARYI